MALVKCGECGARVSSSAAACPHCGAPVAADGRAAGTALTTTQATSKQLKLHTLISVLAIIVGLVWLLIAASGEDAAKADRTRIIPALLLGLGIVGYFVTRVRIWWHHG